MKNISVITVFLFGIVLASCSSETVKENINKTGDVAGQVVGEFATGVTNGVNKAINPKIEIGKALQEQGIAFGKMQIASDSLGVDNVLISYIIFNSDVKKQVTAKAVDAKNAEMGRVKILIEGKKDDAKYFEFRFDKRTEIDNDSKIILE